MFFFEPGVSLTPKNTYSDNALSIPNANPVILDASGLLPNVFLDGAYRVILAPSTLDNSIVTGGTFTPSQIIWDRDDVNSITTPFSPWIPSFEYGEGGNNIVIGSDGNYYVSLVPNNVGNDPVSSPYEWQMIHFFSGTEEAYANLESLASLVPQDQYILVGTGTGWATQSLAQTIPNYLAGLGTANNTTDADHDIDIAAGMCTDSTNARILTVAATTKRIDATWVAGSGNGGLASGAVLGANASYHVFAVRVGSATDVMFDSSPVCANGVANNAVTHFRRIASIMTDGSSNIIPYIQDGDQFDLMAMVQDVNITNPGTSALTANLSIPEGVVMAAKVYASLRQSTGTQYGIYYLSALAWDDLDPSTGQGQAIVNFATSATSLCYIPTNTSAQIRHRMAPTAGATTNFTIQINTVGWIDGRDS